MSTVFIAGANRGIGLELARIYARRGDHVIATARNPAKADALNALAGETGNITLRALDVVDEDSINALAGETTEALDLMVLNAGVFMARGGMDDPAHSVKTWQDVLMTNIAGPFLVARALMPALRQGKGKKIAIMSSAMGSSERAPGNAYIYRASKAAAVNIARNFAAELGPQGIAVGAYHPGWVRTDMGGAEADLSVEESAAGLAARFDALSPATNGVFEDYAGVPIPF